jgi:hypothetical protein
MLRADNLGTDFKGVRGGAGLAPSHRRRAVEETVWWRTGTGTGGLSPILGVLCGRCKGLTFVGFTIAVGLDVLGVLIASAELIDPALDLAGVFGNEQSSFLLSQPN